MTPQASPDHRPRFPGPHPQRRAVADQVQRPAGPDMKTIQEILGHSSIVITADTYTLLFDDFDRTVTEAAANLIHHRRKKAA